MRKITAFAFALALVTTFGATASLAAERDDADARFEAFLRAIDVVPTRAQLDRAWPDARDRLIAAAEDDGRDHWTRLRALSMTSFYPEAKVRVTLTTLSEHPEPSIRRLAVYTLGRTFGSPGDEALVQRVVAATTDKVPEVRHHAIRALRWIGHPAALRALERLEREHADPKARRLARTARERRR